MPKKREANKVNKAAKGASKAAPVAFVNNGNVTPETRKSDGRWQKGFSGNPGGQPKGMAEVKSLARSFTTDAISTLAEIMKDTEQSGPARVSAATALLDRGYGKPVQQVEQGKPGDFSDLADAELDAFILSQATKFVEERRTVN